MQVHLHRLWIPEMVDYQDDFIRISVCIRKKKVLMNSSVNSVAVRDKSIIIFIFASSTVSFFNQRPC